MMNETKNKYLFGAKLSILNGKEVKVKIVEHSGTVTEGVVTAYTRGGYDAKGNVIKPGTGISNSKGVSRIDIDSIEQLFYN
jgi:hypothetical protein